MLFVYFDLSVFLVLDRTDTIVVVFVEIVFDIVEIDDVDFGIFVVVSNFGFDIVIDIVDLY